MRGRRGVWASAVLGGAWAAAVFFHVVEVGAPSTSHVGLYARRARSFSPHPLLVCTITRV